MHGFLHADRNGLQIAPRETAIRWIPFGQDQQIFLLLRECVVIRTQEPADVGHAVFLRGHGAAIAVGKHFLRDLFRSP